MYTYLKQFFQDVLIYNRYLRQLFLVAGWEDYIRKKKNKLIKIFEERKYANKYPKIFDCTRKVFPFF